MSSQVNENLPNSTVYNYKYETLRNVNQYRPESQCMSMDSQRTSYDLMVAAAMKTPEGMNSMVLPNSKGQCFMKGWTRTGL